MTTTASWQHHVEAIEAFTNKESHEIVPTAWQRARKVCSHRASPRFSPLLGSEILQDGAETAGLPHAGILAVCVSGFGLSQRVVLPQQVCAMRGSVAEFET